MNKLSIYLLFDGTCKPAMEFYNEIFGGELHMTKVAETPAKDQLPVNFHEKILNARLLSSQIDISASDWLRPQETPIQGNKVCLYLSGGQFNNLKSIFDKLSEGANVTDPLRKEFYGAYGALNDKFGNRWMFHTEN